MICHKWTDAVHISRTLLWKPCAQSQLHMCAAYAMHACRCPYHYVIPIIDWLARERELEWKKTVTIDIVVFIVFRTRRKNNTEVALSRCSCTSFLLLSFTVSCFYSFRTFSVAFKAENSVYTLRIGLICLLSVWTDGFCIFSAKTIISRFTAVAIFYRYRQMQSSRKHAHTHMCVIYIYYYCHLLLLFCANV